MTLRSLFQVKQNKMKRTASKKSHSWWWDSHVSPKNSKWLQENLEGKRLDCIFSSLKYPMLYFFLVTACFPIRECGYPN